MREERQEARPGERRICNALSHYTLLHSILAEEHDEDFCICISLFVFEYVCVYAIYVTNSSNLSY